MDQSREKIACEFPRVAHHPSIPLEDDIAEQEEDAWNGM